MFILIWLKLNAKLSFLSQKATSDVCVVYREWVAMSVPVFYKEKNGYTEVRTGSVNQRYEHWTRGRNRNGRNQYGMRLNDVSSNKVFNGTNKVFNGRQQGPEGPRCYRGAKEYPAFYLAPTLVGFPTPKPNALSKGGSVCPHSAISKKSQKKKSKVDGLSEGRGRHILSVSGRY